MNIHVKRIQCSVWHTVSAQLSAFILWLGLAPNPLHIKMRSNKIIPNSPVGTRGSGWAQGCVCEEQSRPILFNHRSLLYSHNLILKKYICA